MKEVLIFTEVLQLLYLIGFEEIEIDRITCLIYNGGFENEEILDQTLRILRNKQKNEIMSLLSFADDEISKDPKRLEVDKEVQKRKNEFEENKKIKEKIIQDFEANKKFNLEAKKSYQTETIEKKLENYRRISVGNNVLVSSDEKKYEKSNPIIDNKFSNISEFPKKPSKPKMVQNRNTIGGNQERKKTKKKKVVSLQDYGRML